MGTQAQAPPPTTQPSEFVPCNILVPPDRPSPAVYVGFNDFIQVNSTCQFGNTFVARLFARLIRRDGTIVSIELDLNSTTAYGNWTQRLQLCEGWLIAVTVVPTGFISGRGQLFSLVSIARSTGSGVVPVVLLCSDYVTQSKPVGWPGGTVRDSTEGPGAIIVTSLASPPAGNEWVYQVPANTRERFISVGATLTTSAQVANRQPRLTINGVAADLWFVAPGFNAVASGGYVYSWLPGCAGLISTPPAYTLPLVDYLPATPIYTLGTATVGLQSLDTWGNIYIVTERWLDAG